jgi:hypothetical protein
MSKIFYDRLVSLEKVEKEISKIAQSPEEKEDLHKLVDEYIHHRMMDCILDRLPAQHHERFLTQVSESPHHDGLWDLLKNTISDDIENFLRDEAFKIGVELLAIIKPKSSK